MAIFVKKLSYASCKKLATTRFNEAKLLLSNRKYSGAYYLSGYSLELAIKAFYCKKIKRYSFPPEPSVIRDIYTHDLNKLMVVSEFKRILDTDIISNQNLQNSWGIAKDWSEESRYTIIRKVDSIAMLDAVEIIFNWIQTKW